jgi:type II secretory pathway component PulJ
VEPTHGEILRAIGVLEGQLKQLLDAATNDKGERSSLGERIGRLEQRMAQVVIAAVVLAVLSPMIWTEVSTMIKAPQHMERSK